jgi:hypothetical protein
MKKRMCPEEHNPADSCIPKTIALPQTLNLQREM